VHNGSISIVDQKNGTKLAKTKIEILKEFPDHGIKIELVKQPLPLVRVVDTVTGHLINIKNSSFGPNLGFSIEECTVRLKRFKFHKNTTPNMQEDAR